MSIAYLGKVTERKKAGSGFSFEIGKSKEQHLSPLWAGSLVTSADLAAVPGGWARHTWNALRRYLPNCIDTHNFYLNLLFATPGTCTCNHLSGSESQSGLKCHKECLYLRIIFMEVGLWSSENFKIWLCSQNIRIVRRGQTVLGYKEIGNGLGQVNRYIYLVLWASLSFITSRYFIDTFFYSVVKL